jgi:hypothetical protein
MNAESSRAISQDNAGNEDEANNWLPLPETDLRSAASCEVSKSITGCIRTDEIIVHSRSGSGISPMWTAQGSVQWVGVLQEAQLYGHMVRLLIHPRMPGLSLDDTFIAESVLEVYLSRGQWRDVEVASGQQLILEIPSKAIHLFDALAI